MDGIEGEVYVDANLIAHWANLGFVEEDVICNHILQSLISHPRLCGHQADTFNILLKLAGATFEAYAYPSMVGHYFELLGDRMYYSLHCSQAVATQTKDMDRTLGRNYYQSSTPA